MKNIVNIISFCLFSFGLFISCHSKQDDLNLFECVLNDYEFPENCRILVETLNYNELDLSIDLKELTDLKLENDLFDLTSLVAQKDGSFSKLKYYNQYDLKFELISEDQFPAIWRKDSSFKGLIRFGKPFYSKKSKYAYIECFFKCRGNCGFQVGVVYKRDNNGWKKWKELHYGIS